MILKNCAASLFAMTMGLATLAGCTAAPADEVDAVDSSEDELTTSGAAQNVSWEYLDRIGRGVDQQFTVPGQVAVRFVGPRQTVPHAVFEDRSVEVQSAQVSMRMPDMNDPSSSVVRRYLVRFETSDGGQTFSAGGWDNSVIVDRSRPGAAATFASSNNGVFIANGVSDIGINLKKGPGNSYSPEIALGGPFFQRNHAIHHITVRTKTK